MIFLEYVNENDRGLIGAEFDMLDEKEAIAEIEKRQRDFFQDKKEILDKIIKDSFPNLLNSLYTIKENFPNRTLDNALFTLSYSPENGVDLSCESITFRNEKKTDDEISNELLNAYSYLLNLLKEQAPERYKKIIKFIDEILENRKPFKYERHGLIQSELYKFTLRKKKKKELDPILDILKIKEENFILFISSFSKVKWLRQSALQLLDIIIMDFTEKGAEDTDREISIPLKNYMEMRGLKDEKEARKQIKEDLEALYNLKFEKFTQPIHGKKEDFFNLAIIGSHGIENGKIIVSLDGVFSKLLAYYPAIPIHKGVFKLKANKNPCAYYFSKKIHEHKFMNSGKKNEDIIAVMTLLEAAQNVLPSYEEVFNGNRDYKKKIIAPFYRDMEALVDIGMLSEWTYWHKNGIPLTYAELDNLDYETFKGLNVKVTWTEYPDQSNRLEAKNKRIKAAEKRRKNQRTKNNLSPLICQEVKHN